MKDRELFCEDVEWFLTARDADCGVRSSFGAMVAAIEGATGGGSTLSPDPYHDGQAELAGAPGGRGQRSAFAKDRRLRRVWLTLDAESQRVLAAHYVGIRPELEPNIRQALHRELDDLASAASWLMSDDAFAELATAALNKGHVGRTATLDAAKASIDAKVRHAHRAWYAAAGAIALALEAAAAA